MTRDATEIARLSAQALWAEDKASQGLGMEVLEVGPGRAKLAMTLTERMVNGHGLGHGGFIFTLADRLAAAPTYGLALSKRALAAASGNTLATQLDLERELQQLAGASPDAAEGITAFLEKRTPTFSGSKA